jgi:hypothetical protein
MISVCKKLKLFLAVYLEFILEDREVDERFLQNIEVLSILKVNTIKSS